MERPTVYLELVGLDGNSYSLMGAWQVAARRAGWSQENIKEVLDDATSGDRDHLLQVLVANCEPPEEGDD